MNKELICPFTKSKIEHFSSYVKVKPKEFGVSRLKLKYLVYLETFGSVVTENNFKDYYEIKKYSLPLFLKEFGLSYTMTKFLIKYHNCKKRNLKQSTLIGATRAKITNLERYGVDQTFKVKEFNDKRKQTYQERYGVDNPFKQKDFFEKIEETFEQKYKLSRREFYSIKGKELWNKKSKEEQQRLIKKRAAGGSNVTLIALGKVNSGSRLEKRVASALLDLNTTVVCQFKLKNWKYDFFLKDYNLIIEVYGDHIHANPNFYKPNDILPLNKKKCQEIWDYDKKRLDHANSLGYTTAVIWQSEMKFLSNKNLLILIYEKINENYKNQEDNKAQ